MLRALKPYLGPVVDTSATAVPYMENQQVWIGPCWSARSVYYMKRCLPISMTVPKEGTISLGTTSAVPIGFCLEYNISPGRPDIPDWPADFVAQQVTTEEKMRALTFPDLDYLAAQQRPRTEKWQDIMAG